MAEKRKATLTSLEHGYYVILLKKGPSKQLYVMKG